mgnify:CR=1 FL=1
MISSDARKSLSLRLNDRFFYGWVMLGVGGIGLFASGPAQSHTFSVFITPICADLGMSATAVASAYAGATLVASLGLPFMGRLADRFGFRIMTLWIGLLFGFALIAFGQIANAAMLAIGFAALRFLGQGSLMLNSNGLVSQWFSRKRGFALAVATFGFSISMAVHPAVAQWLIDHVGWRESWMWMGLATWVLVLPGALFLMQNKPEDLGLQPDGGTADGADAGNGPRDAVDVGLSLQEAMRTGAFWIVALTLGSFSLLVTAMFFHQVSILGHQGISPQTASQIFTISAVTMVVTMPIVGRLLDRLPTQPVFATSMLVVAGALIAMANVDGLASAVIFSLVFGAANGASQAHITFVWPRFFGRKHLASILGVAQMITVVGASIGPLPFGIAFDLFGDYTGALYGTAALPVVCAIAVLFLRPPKIPGRDL